MVTEEEVKELLERAVKFSLLELPGQPQGMHMGTAYLVSDLRRAVEELSEWVYAQSTPISPR